MSDSSHSGPAPVDISLNPAKDTLTVTWEDGGTSALPAELLRVESPSAEVQGHGSGQKATPAGKRGVTIDAIAPVGNYAVKLVFSDGHDTGLFTWETLHRYGLEAEKLMREYEGRLRALGLSRDG